MSRFIMLVTILAFLAACGAKKDKNSNQNQDNTADATAQPNQEGGDNAKDETPTNTEAQTDCTCGAGKAGGTTWCEKCGVGYIKGEKSKDKAAVDGAGKAAHAHGHDHAGHGHGHDHAGHGHGTAKKACSCGAGKAGGTTWCESCGVGYIKGEKTKEKVAVTKALAGPTEKPIAPAPAE